MTDGLGHYMEATARMRVRAEKAEAERDAARRRTHKIAEKRDAEHRERLRELTQLRKHLDEARERTRDWKPEKVGQGVQWADYPGSWWAHSSHNSCMDVAALVAERNEAQAERDALLAALLTARADIVGVNAAGFDSTRGEVAVRAIKRIDAALAAVHPETSTPTKEDQ